MAVDKDGSLHIFEDGGQFEQPQQTGPSGEDEFFSQLESIIKSDKKGEQFLEHLKKVREGYETEINRINQERELDKLLLTEYQNALKVYADQTNWYPVEHAAPSFATPGYTPGTRHVFIANESFSPEAASRVEAQPWKPAQSVLHGFKFYSKITPTSARRITVPFTLNTTEGSKAVKAGSWILKDEQGQLVCLTDEEFKKQYRALK